MLDILINELTKISRDFDKIRNRLCFFINDDDGMMPPRLLALPTGAYKF